MKLITAFFRLIRSLNLLFIALTQFLFYYCVVIPSYSNTGAVPLLEPRNFWLLVLASVSIAAAGYIINDYFDINIDRINKPGKLVVERIIKRRWAIVWHLLLSATGILLSFYVGWKTHHDLMLGISNTVTVVLLWFYSTTFKKKLLSGNLIISLLTAWVVLILYAVEMERSFYTLVQPEVLQAVSRIFKLAVLYGGFAFIISLARECIKDIEDMPGDQKYGCRTMPVVWGIRATKIFIANWLVVLMAAILILQFYVIPFGWWYSIIYAVLLILAPAFYILRNVLKAQTTADYHRISNWIKLVMMTGILSLVFFFYYA